MDELDLDALVSGFACEDETDAMKMARRITDCIALLLLMLPLMNVLRIYL